MRSFVSGAGSSAGAAAMGDKQDRVPQGDMQIEHLALSAARFIACLL